MIKRKFATFMLTLMLVMTSVSTIRVIGYAQEESSGSSTNPQEELQNISTVLKVILKKVSH